MTLKELEGKLESIQEDQGVTYSSLKKAGLSYLTAKHIQTGDNYQVNMLFKYVDLLCCYLIVDERVIEGMEQLGSYLSSIREKKRISSTQMSSRMEVTNNTVAAIERGRGYRRDSLLKYVAVLGGIEFDIDEIVNRI